MSRQLLCKPDVWGDARRHAESRPPVKMNLTGLARVQDYAERARARRVYANRLVFPPLLVIVAGILTLYYVMWNESPAASLYVPILLAVVSIVPPYYVWCWSRDSEGIKVLLAVAASFTIVGSIFTAALLFNQSKAIARIAVP